MKPDPVSSQTRTGGAKRGSAIVDALFLLHRGNRLKTAAKVIAATRLKANPCPIRAGYRYPESEILNTKQAVILSERGPERFSVRRW